MESERPMDRLICGDVGYGKTEVALRAAFKAASEGRQTLVLAPTTILAQQHFGTFSERLRDYPFRIELLSRFRCAAKDQRAAIRDFADGQGRRPDRDAPAALARRAAEGPGPRDRRRGAALRREAEGGAAPAAPERRRAGAVGDADPAHAADVARRHARHLGDRDPARGPAPDPHLCRRLRRRPREGRDRAGAGRGGQVFYLHDRVEDIEEAAERVRALVPSARVVGRARPDGLRRSSSRR